METIVQTPNRLETDKGNGPATEQKDKAKYGDFGQGRYSALAMEAYKDAKRLLGLTEKQADKFARTLSADWGRAQFTVAGKYGNKADAEGFTTLREVSKAKVKETRAITLARGLTKLQEVKASIGETDSSFKGFVIAEEIVEWLNS